MFSRVKIVLPFAVFCFISYYQSHPNWSRRYTENDLISLRFRSTVLVPSILTETKTLEILKLKRFDETPWATSKKSHLF